jgi:hypothetical protein
MPNQPLLLQNCDLPHECGCDGHENVLIRSDFHLIQTSDTYKKGKKSGRTTEQVFLAKTLSPAEKTVSKLVPTIGQPTQYNI